MDFHTNTSWRELGTEGRINAIRSAWYPKCSASQIAANLGGVTRNAVIGIYHRFGDHLSDVPLRERTRRATKPRARVYKMKAPTLNKAPKPDPVFVANEFHLCGKPMVMLQPKECRWAVNDAEGDELHIFCGRPAEHSYCAHHHARVYRVSL